jgi:SOS-response transcriptional repressor LexA
MNKTFGEIVKEKRLEKGWTQTQLAVKSGIKQGSISRIEANEQTNLTEETKNKLLNTLELYGIVHQIPDRHTKPIPVISWVHAGQFADAVDSWPVGVSGISDPVFSYFKTGPNAFGLIIEGDSMAPRFLPGDVAIVDPAIR